MFDVTHGTQKQRFQKYITQNKNQIKILYNFMQHAQIKRKVVLTSTLEMVRNSSMTTFDELVQKFIPESIGREIEKATSSIYPLQNVFIRKVKILKAPKFDLGKLMEVHGDYSEDVGVKMERPADEPVAEETEVIGA